MGYEVDPELGSDDFDDVEWELLCSAREASVGSVPGPDGRALTRLAASAPFHPWDRP